MLKKNPGEALTVDDLQQFVELDTRYEVQSFKKPTDFGDLYTGLDKDTGQKVAIKLLTFDTVEEVEEQLVELKKLKELDHPQHEKLLWFTRTTNHLIVVSEWIDMHPQQQWFRDNHHQFQSIAAMIEKIARLAQKASDEGIVHGNIKHTNVVFDGEPRILGYGLYSKRLTDLDSENLVREVNYLAPEYLKGDQERIGIWTDVYSLGQILYWSLTGNLPFHGVAPKHAASTVRHGRPTIPRIIHREIPRSLEAICMKALSKRLTRRYSSPAEFADDLHRFQNDDLVEASLLRRESVIKGVLVLIIGMFMLIALAAGVYIGFPLLTN